jgi:hypothetical protein
MRVVRSSIWSMALFIALTSVSHAEYRYRQFDVPFTGAFATNITGLDSQGTLVGLYQDAQGRVHGFLLRPRQTIAPLFNLTPLGLTDSGFIVGNYVTPNRELLGFVAQDGTFFSLRVPPPNPWEDPFTLYTEAMGVNEAGIVVGDYRSGIDREFFGGFLYDPATGRYTTVAFPGAHTTALLGINNLGQAVGFYYVGNFVPHGLYFDGETLSALTIPGIDEPQPVGITDDGTIVGNGETTAWVFKDGVVEEIAYPGASFTDVTGIRNDGVVYGFFVTDVTDASTMHGFLAWPDGKPGKGQVKRQTRQAQQVDLALLCGPGSKRWACRAR